MARPAELKFTAGFNSPVATAARSQHHTASLLYDKLQAEKRKNALTEQRAEQATRNAHKAVAQAADEQHRTERELRQVKDRLRQVNSELDEKCRPPKDVLERVHALESIAHIHKQRLAELSPGTEEHTACADEHAFHSAVARRARHSAITGESEQVRHVHLNPEVARAHATTESLDDRLGSILKRQGLAPPEPTEARAEGGAPAGYEERVNNFMDAVCTDLRAGLKQASEAYTAAAVGPVAAPV